MRLGSARAADAPHPAAAVAEQESADDPLRAGVPAAFLFVGAAYAVLSGTIFLQVSGKTATGLWAATAGLGLVLVGVGFWMRNAAWPPARLRWVAAVLAVAVMLHALVVLWVTRDPQQTSYLLILLVGAGYLLLSTPSLLAVDAVAAAGWVVVSQSLGIPVLGAAGELVVAGLLLGGLAHLLRRRALARLAQAHAAAQGTLSASEERFQSLAETAQDAILILEQDGRLAYLNPAGMRLFGLAARDIGRPAGHLLGAAGNQPDSIVGTTELVAQRKDGSTFPAELSLARARREGDVVYTGILRDISERKRAAQATQAAAAHESELDTLRKMNSFKTTFLNTAAHELNTPLTPLRLQLHLLKSGSMGALNEKQGKAIALLDRNVVRLSGLVGEILDVARLQSGAVRVTPVAVDVDAVVDEVIESFNETARRVGVALSFQGNPGLIAFADRNRFTQVLFNLVSNGLKFTPAGGAVTVRATPTGTAVTIDVEDTGLGLTSEQMERLFQPFSQVHDPMSVTASGTGLGLYICKGLLEAMGGAITCRSAGPGHGSTFSFTLPASSTAAPPPAVDAMAAVIPGRRPLIVEDAMARRLRELI